MRLTVGPLPPAVYWRRRAVVLGAGLLFLIVLLYSCTGTDRNTGAPGTDPSPTGSAGAQPDPSGSVLTPQSGSPSPTPGDSGGGGANNGGGNNGGGNTGGEDDGGGANNGGGTGNGGATGQPVSDDGTCTDSELLVTPVAVPQTAQRGTVVTLRLKVKNVSNRTCSRNIGADLQELYIKAGAEKIWSSDTCGTGTGSYVQSFTPNFERSYELGWNGRLDNKCANGLANGEFAAIGAYQVFARVGTKISEPVKLTVTG
ncbi:MULTISPECIES: hypothetical protein [unclassified Micromonospora]|uniref:hypothetical protein n=1 Tax=unclassified Micromonospora TaxID=2617518 RepID=UPI001C245A17|nr:MULTISPECIES: hypothetical protein [unclassified Micromonospora]MBU8857468.1 hypothetical protein [Micromonospora sp. WMMB482]MDM4783093.1 hypothetical protein [Micromonospora sp. b486]